MPKGRIFWQAIIVVNLKHMRDRNPAPIQAGACKSGEADDVAHGINVRNVGLIVLVHYNGLALALHDTGRFKT